MDKFFTDDSSGTTWVAGKIGYDDIYRDAMECSEQLCGKEQEAC